MPYDAKVFRILIASPSDVEDEREMVVDAIQAWNDLYSHVRKVVLLPLRWETHTAPEYNSRPQDVINRAIVDECDLLVGIFWTRVGTPTGLAPSGTLEEIERAGNAGKPIMLYFSRIEVDPETLDLKQVELLKDFKKNTFPRGLIESYKKLPEFREKFFRQLEMKVRELQENSNKKENPLELHLMSPKSGLPADSKQAWVLTSKNIVGLEDVNNEDQDEIKRYISRSVRHDLTIPIILGLENTDVSSFHRLFIELELEVDNDYFELTDIAPNNPPYVMWSSLYKAKFYGGSTTSGDEELDKTFKIYESENLQKFERKWKINLEWEAIHQKRLKIVKPYLYLYAPKDGKLVIRAKIYSETTSQPFHVETQMAVSVREAQEELEQYIPSWREMIEDRKKAKEKFPMHIIS